MASRYLCPVFLAVAFWLPSAQAAVVPNVAGQTEAAATRTLANARLAVGSVTLQASATVPAGQVISLSPAAGTSVNDGSWVDLVVSTGPAVGSAPRTVRPPPTSPPTTTPPRTTPPPATQPPNTPTPFQASGAFHISIKNEYVLDLNFGPLGSGWRSGTDEAEGMLEKRGDQYVGTVTAKVDSLQELIGLIGNCGPGHYDDTQQLNVVAREVAGFNLDAQSVFSSRANAAGNEYIVLTFRPNTSPSLRGATRNDVGDTIINCHTLIDTPFGRFLPLNDGRWTLPRGGYIIALPAEGVLNYTDDTVPGQWGTAYAPIFRASKSLWTITVERLR